MLEKSRNMMIACGLNSFCCRFSSLGISQVEKAEVELLLRFRLSKCTISFLQNATRSTIFTAKALNVPHVKCSLNHGGELLANSKAVGKDATYLFPFSGTVLLSISNIAVPEIFSAIFFAVWMFGCALPLNEMKTIKLGKREHHLWKKRDWAGSGQKALGLVRTLYGLPKEKEAVYGALDKWIAWETEFPLVAAAKAL